MTRPDLFHDRLAEITGPDPAAFAALPEADRMARVMRAGAVPDVCGDAVPVAPARGPCIVFDMMASYPKGDGDTVLKPAGWAGRKTMQRADVFDRMRAAALRKRSTIPLSPEQVGMARLYRNLIERHQAGAIRCSSVEGRVSGGGSADAFTDARLQSSRAIDRMRHAIGHGIALEAKRHRAGAPVRDVITVPHLVDAVCLHDMTVSDVLARAGWSVQAVPVRDLTIALGDALQRMIGPPKRVRTVAVVYADPRPIW